MIDDGKNSLLTLHRSLLTAELLAFSGQPEALAVTQYQFAQEPHF